MSYLQKSHKKYVSSYIRPSLRAVCLEENEKRIGLKYKTFHVIGKKGDVFIFDNGNGLHRGEVVKGSTRSILQASFHMGDYVYKDTDRDFLECTYEKSSLRKICKKSLQYLY